MYRIVIRKDGKADETKVDGKVIGFIDSNETTALLNSDEGAKLVAHAEGVVLNFKTVQEVKGKRLVIVSDDFQTKMKGSTIVHISAEISVPVFYANRSIEFKCADDTYYRFFWQD